MGFLAPDPPKIEKPKSKPETEPTKTDAQAEKKAAEERLRQRRAAGRSSTVKTGGQGVTSAAPVRKKTLLGG